MRYYATSEATEEMRSIFEAARKFMRYYATSEATEKMRSIFDKLLVWSQEKIYAKTKTSTG